MDESTRSLKVVLCLTRLPASLTYRSYRDTFQDRSFLAWWVDRVRTWYPSHELYVQCYTEDEQEELEELTGGLADIVCVAGLTRLVRLRELAAILSARELVIVGEGFAFAPKDILSQAIRHHDRRSNLCTDVRGMSIGTTPEIYDLRLLQHPLPFLWRLPKI